MNQTADRVQSKSAGPELVGAAADFDSSDKYFTLFEQASDGVHTYDCEGNFLEVNTKLCQMLGYTREELLELKVQDLIAPEELMNAPVQFEQLRAGQAIISERRLRRKDGTLLPVEISGKMLSTNVLQAIVRDVSERKATEKLLDAQKQSLEMLVSGAPLADVLTYLTTVVEEQAEKRVIAAILLLDEDGRLHNGAAPSLPDAYIAAIEGLKAAPDLGTCSAAAALRTVVITPDIGADPKWEGLKHLPLQLGLRAAWSRPILSRDGRVLGTFGTYFRECRTPSAREQQVVEIMARTAALAIERKRADEALRESEEWLRAIFEASRDGILVENDERIVYVNKSYADLFGYEAAELIGQHVSIVISATDVTRLLGYGKRRAQGDVAESIYEFQGRHKDGTLLDVEASVSSSMIAGRAHITTMVRDIAERKLAQEKLRNSEMRYRLLFENNPLPVWVYDLETLAFLAVNDAAVRHYGYSREEFLRLTLKDIRPAEDIPLLLANLSEPEAGLHLSDVCWRHRKKDGTIIHVEVTCHSFVFEGHAAEIVLAHDVTDRKRAEDALRDAHDDLERRVAARTGELVDSNRALQIEIGERELAQEAHRQLLGQLVTAQEDERRRLARELHDQMGQHLAAMVLLIDSLKRSAPVAATDASLQQLEEVVTQLSDEVDSLAWELRPTTLDDLGLNAALDKYVSKWSERSLIAVDLQSARPGGARLPAAIETAVYRIIQEALTNVLKHSGASSVGLILEQRSNHVSAIIEDNGRGFDAEGLQATPITQQRMGLLSMQERAALVGGSLHIESARGVGTTVYLRIPLGDGANGGH